MLPSAKPSQAAMTMQAASHPQRAMRADPVRGDFAVGRLGLSAE